MNPDLSPEPRRRLATALVAAACAVVALSLPSAGTAGSIRLDVGPLRVVAGLVSGTICGFPPGVTAQIDGRLFVADASGYVTVTDAPVGANGVLAIDFADAGGLLHTATVPLTSATTGLPLSASQILGPLPTVTPAVSVDATSAPGSSTGGASTGTSAANGALGTTGSTGSTGGSAPATPARPSMVEAANITLPNHLVVSRAWFTPSTIRSHARFTARIEVRDANGSLVRGAIVYVRPVPERRLVATTEQQTGADGTVTFTLRPTNLLTLKRGGRLTLFVRARKPGDSVTSGVNGRRLISVRLSKPR
jgi:hypothetical protein